MTARRKRRPPQVPAEAPAAGETLPVAAEAMPVPMSWSPPPEVHAAAARICSLFDTALAVAASIEAQMMEALHEIRRACPDEETFRAVVAEMTPLRPAEAVRMVETWHVARRQRDLRELAQSRPREAMSLVRAFTDAGADDAEVAAFTAADAEVAAVLALPPRKRNARIREMVRREQDAGEASRDPADAERIAELEARVEALSQPPAEHPGQRWRAAVARVRQAEAEMSDVAAEVADLCAGAGATGGAQATRLLRMADGIQESLDVLSGALTGEVDG